MNDTEGLDFVKHTHSYLGEFLRSADQKAAFLLTASVAVLAYLGSGLQDIQAWDDRAVLQAVSTVLVGASAAFSVWAVWPRQHRRAAQGGLIAFRDIYNSKANDAYVSSIRAPTAQPFEQIAKHCYTLSTILVRKYRLLEIAVVLFVIGGVGTMAVLVLRIHSATGSHLGGVAPWHGWNW